MMIGWLCHTVKCVFFYENGKEIKVSEQSNQQEQPTQSSQELRQRMLDQIETEKKALDELSDEELEAVAGGFQAVDTIAVLPPRVVNHNTTGGVLRGTRIVNTIATLPKRTI
jgi:hypothetical protein